MKRAATAVCLLIAGLAIGLHLKSDRTKNENPPAIETKKSDKAEISLEQKRQNIYKDAGYLMKVRGFRKITIPITRQNIYLDAQGFGSGFITNDKDLCKNLEYCIVTAFHVVDDPTLSYFAESKDGSKAQLMELVRGTTYYDFAIMRFADKSFKPESFAKIGKSSELEEGASIYAMGSNAYGNFWYSTNGQLFSKVKSPEPFLNKLLSPILNHPELILCNTDIFPGYSGGPMLNSEGKVVGITVGYVELTNKVISLGSPIDGVKKTIKKMK